MAQLPRTQSLETFRWRLLLLGIAITAIVLLPYVISQRAIESALKSTELVAHTSEVRAETRQLMFLVRDVESAAFARAAGMQARHIRERIEEGQARLGPQLTRLKELLADNPSQLVRVGRLEQVLSARRLLTEEAVLEIDTGRPEQAILALERAAVDFRVSGVAQEIIDEEESLLEQRTKRARTQQRYVAWLAITSAVAQFLLLAGVTWLSERQVRQRLEAQRASQKAIARAQAIFQTVREPIVLLDAKLRLLMHNDAFAEIYGKPQDVSGQPTALIEAGNGVWNDAVLLQRLADVASRDRELWDYETRQVNDGIERILMVNARRMRLPDRDDDVILMTVGDVTAHKRAEQQIRELNRQLEGKVDQVSEVNRELEAFSYSVSHDLRAPLRHVAGFADKLERHLADGVDEKARHYLDVISGSARRMAGLIDDLLVYSRLGRHALRLQAVDMQSLVDEARQVLSTDLGDRNVDWRVQPLPVVVADENMMRQVWQNLLGNAVKYSARRERALIEVSARSLDDGDIEFTVKDNGAGFDMAYAGKLFGVFQRLHKASEFPGSGIGLANVRRILSRHGGRIAAEAAPDEGATFRFTLPAQPGSTS